MWIDFVIYSRFKSKKYYFIFNLTSQVLKNKINDGKYLEGWNKPNLFPKKVQRAHYQLNDVRKQIQHNMPITYVTLSYNNSAPRERERERERPSTSLLSLKEWLR